MTPLTTLERGAKVRRINTLMSACRLIPNRTDILALWNARSYDELTDEEIVALQAYMELAHRTKTTPAPDAIRRLRSQVLAHLTKLGLYASPEDWTKVNPFPAAAADMRASALYARCAGTASAGAQTAGHRRQEARHDLAAFGSGDADLHHSGRRPDRGELT